MDTRTRKKRISAAYRYCFSGLTLQLWLYCEERLEKEADLSGYEDAAGQALARIFRMFLENRDGSDTEDAFGQLKALREGLIKKMERLTAFSDCFQIYEYVLNRMERRFVTLEALEYTPQELAQALVETMASMKEPAQQNAWLRELVAQLPARFTRKKFYAMVMERLTSYVGLDRGSVEGYLDRLKSSVMLLLPEDMEQEEELYGLLECLRRADYKNLDKGGFDRCVDALGRGSRILTEKTDRSLAVEQMVNNLYALFLTARERIMDAAEDAAFRESAEMILDALKQGDRSLLREEILTNMEGIQESTMDLVMAGGQYQDDVLDKVERLVSGSFFMPVDPEPVCEDAADRQWIDEEARKLCQQLDGMFAQHPKHVVRAVMAKVISSLPMVFTNSSQVREYLVNGLESCVDFAEREASMELLEQSLREQRLIEHVLV